ncbi:MAG: biosynthetic-type acetolactate synthase large subunit [Candidatus Caldatribacteriota bacterium]|nr:biosynthetic-type acetolactate synthase large subunit [Atribacterota bacterium]MDD4764277.1 biosynthetic-type acetolactate synthase large subunit [Atribacterota bacterium]
MRLSGTEIVVECLKKEKVEVVFGIPGGAIMPLYDTIYKKQYFRHILTKHEQGAAHAADGYARATGKVGVCFATSGPGATNLVTGLANAYLDSIPVVAFTGQVISPLIGTDAFQEVDITGITLPITKNNYLVMDVKNLASTIKEAFYLARTGRPGPVLIDLPKDVQNAKTEFNYPEKSRYSGYHPTLKGNLNQIKKAAKAIQESKKPVIYAGGGIIASNAAKELKNFVDKTNIPVTTTLTGLGSFPENNPLSLGMLGMHGLASANIAINESDLIVALGTRFDDRVTGNIKRFCPKAKYIHVDIDPAEISKNIKINIPIVGDVKYVLSKMNELIEPKKEIEWLTEIAEIKQKNQLEYKRDNILRPQYIIEKLNEITGGEAIIVTDVGQHQMWAAQYYQYLHPRSFITSGGLGTMGFGLPAAIGAQIGCPKKKVICISGDGGFQMNSQELVTAVNNNLPIVTIIMNNGYLGMVRQWQELFFQKRYSSTNLEGSPDFSKLVEVYGGKGIRVTSKDAFDSALKIALSSKQFMLLDCLIPPEENVFPMVSPGEAINKMLGVNQS